MRLGDFLTLSLVKFVADGIFFSLYYFFEVFGPIFKYDFGIR